MVISSNTICAFVLAATAMATSPASAGGPAFVPGGRSAGAMSSHPAVGIHHARQANYIVNAAYYRLGGYYYGQGFRSPQDNPAPVAPVVAAQPETRLVIVHQYEAVAAPPPVAAYACVAPCFGGPRIIDVARAAPRHQQGRTNYVRPGSAHVIELD